MVKGEVVLHALTIIDGWRVQDLLAALRRNPDIATTLPENPADLMQRLGAPGVPAEGQFLPETYKFPSGTSDVELLQIAHTALARELDAAWRDRAEGLPLKNAYELLTWPRSSRRRSVCPRSCRRLRVCTCVVCRSACACRRIRP